MTMLGKYSKCFEAHGPMVALACNWPDGSGGFAKGFVIVDANQQSFGARMAAARFEETKATGAVVALMRKFAASGALGGIYKELATSDIWLPLFTTRGERPDFWLQLAHGTPPELRFVDASGQVLVRKSSQGTFTKRVPLQRELPPFPLGEGYEDLGAILTRDQGTGVPSSAATERDGGATQALVLPDFQRAARDRLARRLKTVGKAVDKAKAQASQSLGADELARKAQLLQSFLYKVEMGAERLQLSAEETGLEYELTIELDPMLTAGQNLTALFEKAKKAERGRATTKAQVAKSEAELASLGNDLAALRAGPLGLDTVNHILARHGLAAGAGGGASPAAAEAVPYRKFIWRQAGQTDGAGIPILVGKSATDSDELCRLAKGNDLWLHAVGTTGSHVIIPARHVRAGASPSLLKCAAILALHYSKLRGDMAGEVYLSQRQHIKKRRGMAPGLWQIVQAETVYYRYDDGELKAVLDLAAG